MAASLALVFLISGCLGKSGPRDAGDGPGDGASGESSNKLSRQVQNSGGSAQSGGVDPNMTLEKPIKWSGYLPVRAFVCEAPRYDSCSTLTVQYPYPIDNLYIPEINGTVASANLTLSWMPTSELTQELTLGAGGVETCKCPFPDAFTYGDSAKFATGFSSVSLSWQDLKLAEKEDFGVFVFGKIREVGGVGGLVEFDQGFQVTGTVKYHPG